MKIEWMTPQQTTDTPAVAFSFDSVSELTEGRLTISWLNEGGHPVRLHNLVISDTGVDAKTLGEAVIKAMEKPLVKYRKGDINEGTARDVYPIFNDPALPFRAGLTVHAARGTWSSLPHEFEAKEILYTRPMPFYEYFAFITEPAGLGGVVKRNGFLFDKAGNPERICDCLDIRDRDIKEIPLGYHPVSGDAGVRMMYLWVYWDWDNLRGREKF